MKTWEMVKELIENPDKKFENMGFNGRKITVLNVRSFKNIDHSINNNLIVVRAESGKPEPFILNDFLKTRYWKEVDESVDFMDAIRALDKGKEIYVIYGGLHKEDFSPKGNRTNWGIAVKQQQGYAIDTKLILFGKWYIKE